MAEKRKAEYQKGIKKAKASKKEIDFTPVLKSVDNIRKSFLLNAMQPAVGL